MAQKRKTKTRTLEDIIEFAELARILEGIGALGEDALQSVELRIAHVREARRRAAEAVTAP